MKKKFLIILCLFMIVLLTSFVFGVTPFRPKSNVDLQTRYTIHNVSNITGTNVCIQADLNVTYNVSATYFIGDGSLLSNAGYANPATYDLNMSGNAIRNSSNVTATSLNADFLYGDASTAVMNWTGLQHYPVACPASQYISAINDSVTCSEPTGGFANPATHDLNMSGHKINNVSEINYNVSDADLYFKINDGGTTKTAFYIDASDKGKIYMGGGNLDMNNGQILNTHSISIHGGYHIGIDYTDDQAQGLVILATSPSSVSSTVAGFVTDTYRDQFLILTGSELKNSFVLTDNAHVLVNHSLPIYADPHFLIFSSTNVGSDNTEWLSLAYVNATDYANISTGKGDIMVAPESGILIIQPEPAPDACDSTTEGGIYYNNSDFKHYGCNSTTWNALY